MKPLLLFLIMFVFAAQTFGQDAAAMPNRCLEQTRISRISEDGSWNGWGAGVSTLAPGGGHGVAGSANLSTVELFEGRTALINLLY